MSRYCPTVPPRLRDDDRGIQTSVPSGNDRSSGQVTAWLGAALNLIDRRAVVQTLIRKDLPCGPPPTGPGCAAWSDQELAEAVCHRSVDAYGEIYRRYATTVGAGARTVLGGGPGVDDIVAEVFVALWESPERFDATRGSLSGFLRMGARGRSIDLLRSETSRRRREEEDLVSAPTTAIEAELLSCETAAELRDAVSLLPAPEREAIQLAFFEGLSYRAVAVTLHEAEGTVKSRIRSGLRRLRANVSVLLQDGEPGAVPGLPAAVVARVVAHEARW